MAKIEDYVTGEDLAQLLENIEKVYYHGWGSVEIAWYNHEIDGQSLKLDSKGHRRRKRPIEIQEDKNEEADSRLLSLD